MYDYSTNKIKNIILEHFPNIKPFDHKNPSKPKEILEHVLWMIFEIQKMKDTLKASRWIGWIYCALGPVGLKIISSDDYKEMARVDMSLIGKHILDLTNQELDYIIEILGRSEKNETLD